MAMIGFKFHREKFILIVVIKKQIYNSRVHKCQQRLYKIRKILVMLRAQQ